MSTLALRRAGSLILAGLAASIGGASAASAGATLLTAGPSGDVWRGDADTGVFQYFGCTCNGPLQSLAVGKDRILAGDIFGSIVMFDLNTGFLIGFSFVPGATTAMVSTGDNLLVSEMSGEIHQLGIETGTSEPGMQAPIEVDAMARDTEYVYVGGPSGDVWRSPIGGGAFTYFACACIPNIRALAVGDGELFAAGVSGLVMRFDLDTGFITGGFVAGFTPTAIAFDAGRLLVSDASGLITKFDVATGDSLGSFQAPRAVEAMVVLNDRPVLLADLSGDGVVNGSDLGAMLGSWGHCGACSADLTGDGAVNAQDLAILLGAWGATNR